MKLTIFIVLILFLEIFKIYSIQFNLNNNPIIGVITQPSSWVSLYDPKDYSYIAASYIKALESSGARVIPIKYDWEEEKILHILQGVNGVLLPGGGTELTENKNETIVLTAYGSVLKKILTLVKQINDKGDYFPVWGTCLGFEAMAITFAEDLTTLNDDYMSLNYGNKLKFLEVFKAIR